MQLDRFTTKAQEALQSAQAIAHQHAHQEIDGEHLLLALISQSDGLIPSLLTSLGLALPALTLDLQRELARRVQVKGLSSTDAFLSQDLKQALDAAEAEARKLKDDYTSTEHLLLGLRDHAEGENGTHPQPNQR